jgi:hypothetical protein
VPRLPGACWIISLARTQASAYASAVHPSFTRTSKTKIIDSEYRLRGAYHRHGISHIPRQQLQASFKPRNESVTLRPGCVIREHDVSRPIFEKYSKQLFRLPTIFQRLGRQCCGPLLADHALVNRESARRWHFDESHATVEYQLAKTDWLST